MSDVPILGIAFLLLIVSAPLWVKRMRTGAPSSAVRVVARTALSRSATLVVVEVGGRRLLLGAGDQGVRVLTELDPDDRKDAADESEFSTGSPVLLPTSGPRTGLLDRLRSVTVRTTPAGRPFRVPSRR